MPHRAPQPSIRTPRLLLHPLAAAIALLGAGTVRADGAQPYYIGLNETISHDSNIYKLSGSGSQTSTTQSSTSLVGGFDQPLGRQLLHADAFVSENRYFNRSTLNNTSYGLNSVLDWSTVGRLSGVLGVAFNRSLANYAATTLLPQEPTTQRNLATSQNYYGRFTKGMLTSWSWDGGLAHRALDYSAPQYASGKFRENSGDFGLTYHPSDLLSVGVTVGYAKGDYPDFVPFAGAAPGDSYVRRDYNVHANYTLSGFTSVYGRIGYTDQTNSSFRNQDFSGLTGALRFNHTAGGKLSYFGSIARDTGNSFNPTATGVSATVPVTTPVTTPGSPTPTPTLPGTTEESTYGVAQTSVTESIGVNYAATSKVGVAAGYSHDNRNLRGPTGGNGTDTSNSVFVNARYTPQRYLSLGCGVTYTKRSSDTALSGSYSDRFASCSAQLTLR